LTLPSTGARTKVFVVLSLSSAAENAKDDGLGVSGDSGDVKYQKESCDVTTTRPFFTKADGNIQTGSGPEVDSS